MPSRTKSKIFSLPKLRSRSRSVAKKGGKRLEDDGGGGEEERRRRPKRGGVAAIAAPPPPPTAAVSPPPAAARAPERTKLPQHAATATTAARGGRIRRPASPSPAERNGAHRAVKRPIETAAAPQAASNNASYSMETSPPTQRSQLTPPTRESTDSSRDTAASDLDVDDHFVTAFTRSPPSFDNFDSDLLAFPRPVAYSGSLSVASSHRSGRSSHPSLGHSHSGGHDSRGSVGLNGSCSGEEPHGVGPHGILWGDSSVINDGEGDANDVAHSFSGSVDPPAILIGLDEDDLIDDEDPDSPGRMDEKGTRNQNKGRGGEWFGSFANGPKDQNRRVVSPSPVKTDKPTNGPGDDDLAAWGGLTSAEQKGQGNFNENDDVFGSNFFKSNGFDGNDGFGAVEDNFAWNSWMDVNAGDGNNKKKKGGAGDGDESDPWGEASFVDTSFNYSRSNEESEQGPLLEEKKDDEVVGQSAVRDDEDPPAAQAPKVWDGQADGAPTALVTPSQTGKDAPSNHSKLHPLKAPPPRKQEKHEVVVTFDKSLTSGRRPPSIISERKASQGNGAVVVPAHRGHRRLNSKESLSSNRSQLSTSRRGRKKGDGSVSSSHSRRGDRRRGGGSVGSNSSAVDQILEHYRQKRRLAKDKVGGRVTPSGSGSAHSGAHAGGGGSASVHSGSQFSTPGSSSGAGTSVGNGGGVAGSTGSNPSGSGSVPGGQAMHRRIPSGGSSGHRRIPSSGSSSHRSNESVSRIIDNLETAAAATVTAATANSGKATIAHSAPSPAMGKYYPPSANGVVGGVGGMAGGDDAADHQFLLANIEATIGPRGVAPDMESLSGRSVRSLRSQSQPRPRSSSSKRHGGRPHRSPTRGNNRRISADTSVDSRTSKASRNSFRTYQSTRSALTTMSKETQSVANDLFRLEAQLAEVARQQEEEEHPKGGAAAARPPSAEIAAYPTVGDPRIDARAKNTLGAEPVPRPTPFQITAPPGKLGILLSNKSGQKGPTHVSAVRSESVLAGRVHVGDVFVSIDGEDVTRMNSKEITTVMARKAEFERVLRFRPLVSSLPQRQEWI